MSIARKSFHVIQLQKRTNKNFVYKGQKYQINFNLVKNNSNYFYNNQDPFESDDIELIDNSIELSEDAILNFIKCCQNEEFQINDSNVDSLHQLSIQYDVPELKKLTDAYLAEKEEKIDCKTILSKLKENEKQINDLADAVKSREEKNLELFLQMQNFEEMITNIQSEINELKSNQAVLKIIYDEHLQKNENTAQKPQKAQISTKNPISIPKTTHIRLVPK